jgi:hypothetical protein
MIRPEQGMTETAQQTGQGAWGETEQLHQVMGSSWFWDEQPQGHQSQDHKGHGEARRRGRGAVENWKT